MFQTPPCLYKQSDFRRYQMSNAAKNWCFTINNYTEDELELMSDLSTRIPNEISYLIIGKETGENGTPHFQGYIQMVKKLRLGQIRNLLGGRAHCEIMAPNSTPWAASTYCKKEGDFQEWGQLQNRGILDDCYMRLIIDE